MKRFSEDIEMMLRKKPPQIFSIMLYYITPVIFVVSANVFVIYAELLIPVKTMLFLKLSKTFFKII